MAEIERTNPWPRRCEMVALVASLVLVCAVLQGILTAAGTSTADLGTSVTAADRLRISAEYLSAFVGLLALVAAGLVAVAGLMAGDARPPLSAAGRTALFVTALISAVAVVADLARVVDILAGHLSVAGRSPASAMARLGGVAGELGSALLAAVACRLSFWTIEDADGLVRDEEAEHDPDDPYTEAAGPGDDDDEAGHH